MAERCRPVALEGAMREPGAGIAGERRGEGKTPVAAYCRQDDKRNAERRTDIMRHAGPRIAMGAQVMRPEFGIGGDRTGHGDRVLQIPRFPQMLRSEPSPASGERAPGRARSLDALAAPSHPHPMPPKPRQSPVLSAHGKADAARRQAREAAALRDNIKQRQTQGRAREATPPTDPLDKRGEA